MFQEGEERGGMRRKIFACIKKPWYIEKKNESFCGIL